MIRSLEPSKTVPGGIRLFLLILGGAVALCLSAEAVSAFLHLGYPYNWPLMPITSSFMDFRWYFEHFSTLHSVAFFVGPDIIMYPTPVVLCYAFFYQFQPFATVVFLSFIAGSSLLAAVLVGRALVRRGLAPPSAWLAVGITWLLSYPLWFEFKQANMEIVVWVVLSLGIYAFLTDRPMAAAVLFGLAAAAKFYPLIYLGLLLSKKRYRECLCGCLVAGLTIVASLYLVGPTIPAAWHGMQFGLLVFRSQFMIPVRHGEIGFDHSLFALIKVALALARKARLIRLFSDDELSHLLTAYLLIVASAGTILYFLRIRYLPVINQIFCLVLASILLPPVSFDYTGIHLYAPLLLLFFAALKAQQENRQVLGMKAAFIGLALALAPLSEFISSKERFGGQLRCLILLAIFVIALCYPLDRSRAAGESLVPANPLP